MEKRYSLILLCLFFITNSVWAKTENNFIQLLRSKQKLVTSGKISLTFLIYQWNNQQDYQQFAKELRKKTLISPNKFKKWLDGPGSYYLEKAKKTESIKEIYYFNGKKNHLIKEFPKIKYVYNPVTKKNIKISVLPKNIVNHMVTRSEYADNGITIQKLEDYNKEARLSIYSFTEMRRNMYFQLGDLDFSLYPGFVKTPPNSTDFSFTQVGSKYIFSQKSNKKGHTGKMVFDTNLSGGLVHLIDIFDIKNNKKFMIEMIDGGYKEINKTVFLPGFSSVARGIQGGKIQQILYIGTWYLGPIKSKELKIHISLPTTVYDYTRGGNPTISKLIPKSKRN
jgi:hypothetical protein